MGKEKLATSTNWQEFRESILADDPRDSEEERKLKNDIVEKIENGKIAEEQWAYEYDLDIKCK